MFELLLSGLFDLVVELLFRRAGASRKAQSRAHPLMAAIGLFLAGGAAGGLVTWVLPTRLLGTPVVPGASLVVSPLLNGAFMHSYGVWTARGGGRPSFAATFWGGAVFAFGFALVRFVMVGQF